MTTIHIPELTFHRIMNQVDNDNPGLADEKLAIKTREKIVEILDNYLAERLTVRKAV